MKLKSMKRKKVAKPWYLHYDEPPTDEELKKREKKLDKLLEGIKVLPRDQYLKEIQTEDTVLVCMPIPTPGFPDNLQGECDDCGADIYYRPYNNKATTKLCVKCMTKRMEKEFKRKK